MPLTPAEREYLANATVPYDAASYAANDEDLMKRRYIAEGIKLAIHLLDKRATEEGPR